MADQLNGVFISEILADNAGGAAVDVDGDGNINKADEFIELQNVTGSAISLDGYELWSETNGLLFSFGATDSIPANGNATVVGNYTGTMPAGFFDAGIPENGNFIPDGEGSNFDSIFLVDTDTGDYIVLSYGEPPQVPTLPSGFPGTTQLGAGESIDSGAPNGTAFARDANGDLVETTPTPNAPNIPCFLIGTHIATDHGEIPIEDLKPGQRIKTKDHGFVPLRAIGRFRVTSSQIAQHPELLPVCFAPGSIGNTRKLYISGAHRILIEHPFAELLFGHTEVLVPARRCVDHFDADLTPRFKAVTYFHLLFERHEIISAQGSWVESLHLSDLTEHLQPEHWHLAKGFRIDGAHHTKTARPLLKGFEAATLLSKPMTNDRHVSL